MNRMLSGILFLIVAALACIIVIVSSPREATMILANGKIYTLDAGMSVAQAVAIRAGRIVAVGSNDEIESKFKADTILDLHGWTVMPGLVDGHAHMLGEGGKLQTLDLDATASAEEVAESVRVRAGAAQAGSWIVGRGWDQNRWEGKAFPSHEILDQAAPDNPVVLRRVDGHAIWTNRRALELAGVSSATPDPEGGKIYRDAKGDPTGVFVDNAMDIIDKALPPLTDDEIAQRLRLVFRECVKYGLTEVCDMGVDLQTLNVYKKLIDEGRCPLRIYAAIGWPGDGLDYYLKHGKETGFGNGLLTVRAIKLYIDGALGSRGAALIDQYSDDPGNRGLTVMSEADMDSVCALAVDHGFQVCTHAIGDRGNNIVLNAYERALRRLPAGSPSPRWRVEHAQVLQASDIPRLKALGILPSMQPTHATSDMPWAEARLGPERVKGAYAWRSVLRTGSVIIGGSDFPVESVNPLFGFYAAITRSDRNGYPQDGWYPDQKMTRTEAARCFTSWAAYGAFQEQDKGSIEPGKWADLTVLSKDIMEIPPKEILTTEVELTMVGGNIVYERGLNEMP